MADRAGRRIRAWYKRAWAWVLGPVTDPHTHKGSSARIIGHALSYVLGAYVLAPQPDYRVVAALGVVICACMKWRTPSSVASMLTMPAPRDDSPPPAPLAPAAPEMP